MRRFTFVTLGALMVLAFLATPAAEACTCVTSPNLCTQATAADVVFETTVESTELAPRIPPPDQAARTTGPLSASQVLFLGNVRAVSLRDVKPWRGQPQTTVLTAASGDACGYDFRPGTRYLIVASRLDDGRLAVSRCGLTRPITEAAGLLEYIQTVDRPDSAARIWGQLTMPASRIESGRWSDPVPGARVAVVGPVRRSAVTDSGGRYVLADLPAGTYSLNAEMPGSLPYLVLQPQILLGNEVTLAPGKIPACAELNFYARFNGAISGEVVDQERKPLAGVLVELRAAGRDLWTNAPVEMVETDLSGQYRFIGVAPGEYVLRVGTRTSTLYPFAESYARTTDGTSVFALKAGERITVPPIQTRRLSVVLVSGLVQERGGLPVTGAIVTTTMLNEAGQAHMPNLAKTDANGRFQLRLWEGRPYRIVIGSRFNPNAEVEFVAREQSLTITTR